MPATFAARMHDHWSLWLIIVLSAVAFAVRARGLGDGLYRDEPVTLEEIRGRDLLGVLDVVANGVEYNPPLYFILAWASAKLGDPTTLIRLPSLIVATATVPLVFALGLRTIGRPGALVAAGFMALSPFAIYYGSEARAYALLMFLSALSALVLLTAVRTKRASWWAAYGVSVAGVLYTHYTGACVIAVQGAWALWFYREQWRALALTAAGVAVAYSPWLPYAHGDPSNLDLWGRLSGWTDQDAFLQWVAGSPEVSPDRLPGVLAFVLIASGLAVGLLAGSVGWARRRRAREPRRDPPWRSPAGLLVLLLALVTPIALLLYGIVGYDLFVFARNLSASLPFAALALGWALTLPNRMGAVAAVGLAGAGVGIGTVKTLDDRFQRPNFPAVARLIEDRAGPRDAVIHRGSGLEPYVLDKNMRVYYRRKHPITVSVADAEQKLIETRGERPRVFVVAESAEIAQPPAIPGWEQVEHRLFSGLIPLAVAVYERRGREDITFAPDAISP